MAGTEESEFDIIFDLDIGYYLLDIWIEPYVYFFTSKLSLTHCKITALLKFNSEPKPHIYLVWIACTNNDQSYAT